VLEPEPYLEKEEDKYIQQFAKLIMNVGGVPGNWSELVGLPAEIQPLNKPYANWVGGVFRGIVLSGASLCRFADRDRIRESCAQPRDQAFATAGAVTAPHPAYGNMSIRADASGVFELGLPRAGWWGVCALHVGPVTEHQGKPLSQDAVLWIEAKDMR
jgi:cobalt/nickel transport protein